MTDVSKHVDFLNHEVFNRDKWNALKSEDPDLYIKAIELRIEKSRIWLDVVYILEIISFVVYLFYIVYYGMSPISFIILVLSFLISIFAAYYAYLVGDRSATIYGILRSTVIIAAMIIGFDNLKGVCSE